MEDAGHGLVQVLDPEAAAVRPPRELRAGVDGEAHLEVRGEFFLVFFSSSLSFFISSRRQ